MLEKDEDISCVPYSRMDFTMQATGTIDREKPGYCAEGMARLRRFLGFGVYYGYE